MYIVVEDYGTPAPTSRWWESHRSPFGKVGVVWKGGSNDTPSAINVSSSPCAGIYLLLDSQCLQADPRGPNAVLERKHISFSGWHCSLPLCARCVSFAIKPRYIIQNKGSIHEHSHLPAIVPCSDLLAADLSLIFRPSTPSTYERLRTNFMGSADLRTTYPVLRLLLESREALSSIKHLEPIVSWVEAVKQYGNFRLFTRDEAAELTVQQYLQTLHSGARSHGGVHVVCPPAPRADIVHAPACIPKYRPHRHFPLPALCLFTDATKQWRYCHI